jgi:hypothetical protein
MSVSRSPLEAANRPLPSCEDGQARSPGMACRHSLRKHIPTCSPAIGSPTSLEHAGSDLHAVARSSICLLERTDNRASSRWPHQTSEFDQSGLPYLPIHYEKPISRKFLGPLNLDWRATSARQTSVSTFFARRFLAFLFSHQDRPLRLPRFRFRN